MKFFCKILFILPASAVFALGEAGFLETDSLLRESANLRQRACDEKSAWQEEKSRMQSLLDMARKRAELLEKKAVAVAAENTLRSKREALITDKVSRDKSALEAIEAILSSAYAKILEKSHLFECSKNFPSPGEFDKKTAPEKLRIVSAALRNMYEEDLMLGGDKSNLSTGVIVKANGKKGSAMVSEFKAGRGAEK